MSELIVACFEDGHTAFLAAAALARLQKELSINGHDVAVVSKAETGEVTVREAVDLNGHRSLHEAFWKTLVDLLFFPVPLGSAETSSARLSAIGIDDGFTADTRKAVMPGTSVILVLVSETARDRVLGTLRGFGARTRRCRLIGESREQWLHQLSGSQAGETDEQERGT